MRARHGYHDAAGQPWWLYAGAAIAVGVAGIAGVALIIKVLEVVVDFVMGVING
jgi:hypothetical protein